MCRRSVQHSLNGNEGRCVGDQFEWQWRQMCRTVKHSTHLCRLLKSASTLKDFSIQRWVFTTLAIRLPSLLNHVTYITLPDSQLGVLTISQKHPASQHPILILPWGLLNTVDSPTAHHHDQLSILPPGLPNSGLSHFQSSCEEGFTETACMFELKLVRAMLDVMNSYWDFSREHLYVLSSKASSLFLQLDTSRTLHTSSYNRTPTQLVSLLKEPTHVLISRTPLPIAGHLLFFLAGHLYHIKLDD